MSASLQNHSAGTARTLQRRCQRLTCRAQHNSVNPQRHQQPEHPQPPQQQQTSRRRALLLLPAAAAAAVAAGAPRPAAADEPATAAAAAAGTEPLNFESIPATAVDLDVARWPMWVDRNFSFSYPPGLYEVQDLSFAAPPRPRAGADQVTENPLKAEVRSEDGQQRINVVVSQAAALKRTLFQVTDISQLGDPRAVARLLLPPGAAVLSVSSEAVAQPAKDTGTVLGVIQRDPVNYYSYEVVLPDRTHLQVAAAAQLGRLYVLGAQVPEERWAECGPGLKEVARSFRLRYRT